MLEEAPKALRTPISEDRSIIRLTLIFTRLMVGISINKNTISDTNGNKFSHTGIFAVCPNNCRTMVPSRILSAWLLKFIELFGVGHFNLFYHVLVFGFNFRNIGLDAGQYNSHILAV